MADIKWLEGNRIQIAPPKRTKKITGTRFATTALTVEVDTKFLFIGGEKK